MKLMRTTVNFILVLALVLTITACSSGGVPAGLPVTWLPTDEPGTSFDYYQNGSESFGIAIDGRNVISIYDADIDPEKGTFTVTPCERFSSYHYPLSQSFPHVLSITGYGFIPTFWADIELNHPFPGSGIDGFDSRVIAILPANPGVSFNYPALNANANNSVILEPDGYTKLYDNLGGAITGNTNPFKAYFQDQPNRVWSSNVITGEKQYWEMDLSGFGGPLVFKLVVEE